MSKRRTVDVGCASLVVSGEERVERCYAVVIGGLHTTEGGTLQDRSIVGVAHAGVALHADIYALKGAC